MVVDPVAVAKQLHWLEILVGSSKQAVAQAGRDVVAVFTVLVYVVQNSCPDRIKRLAHSSVTGLQPRAKGTMTHKLMRSRMVDVA